MFEKERNTRTEGGSNRPTSIPYKEITKTWLTGQKSCTLIIPREIAHRHGLEEPSHVIVEETPQGIMIRKLEV
jgi:hypothetical protein